MGNLAGLGICCGADSGKQMGKILEDAYILIYDQKCLREENCCTSFTTSVISNQPGGEPGKCRVTGFFILGCAQLLHCGP